jgi:uncharacterized protein YcgI (DUF1989 family)
MAIEDIVVPARRGRAIRLSTGDVVTVFNREGDQVVDTWAFNAGDLTERMSMEHTHATLLKVIPAIGDTLYTNRRRPILTMVEDTSPGIHDTLMPSCDRYRYRLLGVSGYHDNCADNLVAALDEMALKVPDIPAPFNVYMHCPIGPNGQLSFEPPVSRPGDLVRLRAEMDAVVVFSSCPQDILPVNGEACTPVEVHIRTETGARVD